MKRGQRTAIAVLMAALALAAARPAWTHELRPAYLELVEQAPGTFDVTWKVPRIGDATLSLQPRLPRGEGTAILQRTVGGGAVATWTAKLGELRGQTIGIDGLETTLTDALVRVELADGLMVTERLDARSSAFRVPATASALAVATTYLGLGIEHILLGFDHLLFVATLVLVTGWRRSLVGIVTAFTIAHSVTLGLATMGVLHVAQQPVEAVIALSIAFMAAETVRRRNGNEGLASRATWIVAFCFGLLHGLGFAGALSEVGLPHGQIAAALLFFNVGVEAGQLVFLAALYAGSSAGVWYWKRHARAFQLAGAYATGAVSMFWVFSRVAAF
jgi:hypothetical protein